MAARSPAAARATRPGTCPGGGDISFTILSKYCGVQEMETRCLFFSHPLEALSPSSSSRSLGAAPCLAGSKGRAPLAPECSAYVLKELRQKLVVQGRRPEPS